MFGRSCAKRASRLSAVQLLKELELKKQEQ
jgi:hypothetical protein